ncbi:Hypothetical_protein [Hexamita inflata]|uniref:Hypothetical_protein n=1 Tax=Hexamita inflata TaxID=28002 RepID=A0AA86RF54_9EUKA|nr:Hypothetical protein HINF_LOCUS61243 [Hexamita inflata]
MDDSNSSDSNSYDEMSMCNFALPILTKQDQTYKEEYYVINDLVYKKDKESYIFKVLYSEKTESYDEDDENKTRDIVTVNYDLINSKPYTSMGIYCQGAFQLFDFSNLSLVTKNIHKVSIVEGIIDLSLLKGSIQCLKLTNCKVQNSWNPDFHCEELQVTSRDGDISWLQHVKCERILLLYQFCEPNYELLKLKYDHLVNVQFDQITVDLSKLCIKINEIQIKSCNILNQATNYLIVEHLSIIRSKLRTSQLINAQITTLKLQNIFMGFKTMQQYDALIREYYNPTIIDILPNMLNLIIKSCQFNLRSFLYPIINYAKIKGADVENISFKFFQNIENVEMKIEPKYFSEFQRVVQLNKLKMNNQFQEIDILNNRNINIIESVQQIKIKTNYIINIIYLLIFNGDE